MGHLLWQYVSQVNPCIIERLIQCPPDGLGDEAADVGAVKVVHLEPQVGKGGADAGVDIGIVLHPHKVENNVLRAGGVQEDGEDRSRGSTEVVEVKGHGDMDCGIVGG